MRRLLRPVVTMDEQDAIAEQLLRELEQREWAAIVAKSGSQRFLDQLAAEARREDAAGETRDSGERR